MRVIKIISLGVACAALPGCEATSGKRAGQMAQPPVAKAVAHKLEKHGDVRIDNYYWLKEREDPEVIDYLKAENEYTKAMTAHTDKLQKTLFEEINGRNSTS